uniref:ornithine carbamoyltransferase n=1 Tax=Heteropneustes fossilis TaxID=93621 RepID=I1ZED9_HETFO|nr:ornithine carbamoyltransferase [Heteropneustes fossilis]
MFALRSSLSYSLGLAKCCQSRTFSVGTAPMVSVNLKGRSFLTLKVYNSVAIKQILWPTADMTHRIRHRGEQLPLLQGKSIAMVFEKRSSGTRMSTGTGYTLLDGHPCLQTPQEILRWVSQCNTGMACGLSGWANIVSAGVHNQSPLERRDMETSLQLITGLSDRYRATQICVELLSHQENCASLNGRTTTWIGGGYNELHSFKLSLVKLGANLNVASPQGYEPEAVVTEEAQGHAVQYDPRLQVVADAEEPAWEYSALLTDPWGNMGHEVEKNKRLSGLCGYLIPIQTGSAAQTDWTLLHWLPRQPEDVGDAVLCSQLSLCFGEAKSLKWRILALKVCCLTEYRPQVSTRKL